MTAEILVLAYTDDPVASAVVSEWGELPAVGDHVDGAPIRRLGENALFLRRPAVHIHDEAVDLRLPTALRERGPTLVFPSIHRSEKNVRCLTVHALGNPGAGAEFGGRPRTLSPADPRRMVSALRLLDEGAETFGMRATYEATHHGPAVGLPAFFVEIGFGELLHPPPPAVRLLADVIPEIGGESHDRVALGVGGGHYAPHFTDLALSRSWAFGHILSRHALEELDRPTAFDAFTRTIGAEGIVYARAEDARRPVLDGVGPRLRDQDAPARERRRAGQPTGDARSASGT